MSISNPLNIMKLMVKLSLMSKGEGYHPVPSAARSHAQLSGGVSENVIYAAIKSFYWTAISALCKADFISPKENVHIIDGLHDTWLFNVCIYTSLYNFL